MRPGPALLAALALACTACSPGLRACPAIAYLHTLVVEVHDADLVDGVRVCETSFEVVTSEVADGSDLGEGPRPGRTVSPSLSARGDCLEATAGGPATWSLESLPSTPAEVKVELLDADGATLVNRVLEPAWERVGGTARCGGPNEAVVRL